MDGMSSKVEDEALLVLLANPPLLLVCLLAPSGLPPSNRSSRRWPAHVKTVVQPSPETLGGAGRLPSGSESAAAAESKIFTRRLPSTSWASSKFATTSPLRSVLTTGWDSSSPPRTLHCATTTRYPILGATPGAPASMALCFGNQN